MHLTCPCCGAMNSLEALLTEAERGWAYADGIARRMFGLDTLRFCDPAQLRKIAAALEYDKKRRQKKAAATAKEATT